ncbi:MAG TPA: hypothetical protein GXZ90_08690 [Clostridiales bacterium]|nr:hypothetical protein [Clostridiales bacterium]
MHNIRRMAKPLISIIICIIVIILSFTASYFLYIKHIKEDYQAEIDKANQLINENSKTIYLTTKDLYPGDVINDNNTIEASVFTSIKSEDLIDINDLGKPILINIKGNMPVYKTMLSKNYVENDLREEQFEQFFLSVNLMENDYIDLRILYPNGEDYIVLSKKSIKDLSLENNICFLWLNAQEQLTISSAIVDCYLNEGTKLYTSKYIEPNIQSASITTYSPSLETMSLINSNPNIINIAKEGLSEKIRIELESRLYDFYLADPILNNEERNVINVEEEEEFYYVD